MRTRSGYILVQALVAITALVSLLAVMAADQRAQSDVEQNRLRLRRADQAAYAAIARAEASISAANVDEVTLNDDWAEQGSTGNESFQYSDGSASYRMQIVDAGSLINLNNATDTQLEQLPLTQSQVDSLLDWIQPGETARDDGAKDAYYNALNTPYNAKLAPLTTVDEVLLVQGWTPATIYQAPTTQTSLTMPTDQNGNQLPLASLFTAQSGAPNTSSTGTALINLDARSGNTMQQLEGLGLSQQLAMNIAGRTPLTSFSALSAVPGLSRTDMTNLMNGATFSTGTTTSGKVNLNTVSSTVLQTLPNVTSSIASQITGQQSTGFTELGDLANISSLSVTDLENIADNFTVGSNTWIVYAYGESGGVGESLQATLTLTGTTVNIVNVQRLGTGQPPVWWGWSTQTPTTQDSGSSD